jgi:hypothetical protein
MSVAADRMCRSEQVHACRWRWISGCETQAPSTQQDGRCSGAHPNTSLSFDGAGSLPRLARSKCMCYPCLIALPHTVFPHLDSVPYLIQVYLHAFLGSVWCDPGVAVAVTQQTIATEVRLRQLGVDCHLFSSLVSTDLCSKHVM